MTLDEFRRMTEAWGSDIARWPREQRAAAQAMMQEPEAAAILAQARRLDRLILGAAPEVGERRSADAINAVVARLAAEQTKPQARRLRLPRWLAPATGLAFATLFGVFVGLAYPVGALDSSQAAGVMLSAILDSESIALTTVLQ